MSIFFIPKNPLKKIASFFIILQSSLSLEAGINVDHFDTEFEKHLIDLNKRCESETKKLEKYYIDFNKKHEKTIKKFEKYFKSSYQKSVFASGIFFLSGIVKSVSDFAHHMTTTQGFPRFISKGNVYAQTYTEQDLSFLKQIHQNPEIAKTFVSNGEPIADGTMTDIIQGWQN